MEPPPPTEQHTPYLIILLDDATLGEHLDHLLECDVLWKARHIHARVLLQLKPLRRARAAGRLGGLFLLRSFLCLQQVEGWQGSVAHVLGVFETEARWQKACAKCSNTACSAGQARPQLTSCKSSSRDLMDSFFRFRAGASSSLASCKVKKGGIKVQSVYWSELYGVGFDNPARPCSNPTLSH